MTPTGWITLGVGIYASIVATAALVWNILKERHNVIVRVRYAREIGGLSDSQMLAIDIINNGHKPINIQEIGFLLADKTRLANLRAQHNLGWLKDGDGTSFYIPKQEIEGTVKATKEHGDRIIAAYIRDSTSRYYKGKISKNADWFNE